VLYVDLHLTHEVTSPRRRDRDRHRPRRRHPPGRTATGPAGRPKCHKDETRAGLRVSDVCLVLRGDAIRVKLSGHG
jgi:hypothetical protein